MWTVIGELPGHNDLTKDNTASLTQDSEGSHSYMLLSQAESTMVSENYLSLLEKQSHVCRFRCYKLAKKSMKLIILASQLKRLQFTRGILEIINISCKSRLLGLD